MSKQHGVAVAHYTTLPNSHGACTIRCHCGWDVFASTWETAWKDIDEHLKESGVANTAHPAD